eukprot:1182647-Prorocentrum_minimum.AAC.2
MYRIDRNGLHTLRSRNARTAWLHSYQLQFQDGSCCRCVVLPPSGEEYETPGKPPVASTPAASRVGGNPALRLDRPKWQVANLPKQA